MKHPILIITPSLRRPKSLSEQVASLAVNGNSLYDQLLVTRDTGGWIKALNSVSLELVSRYEIVGIINDDVRMRTQDWDKIVLERLSGKMALLYGRDGIQDERLCTQPFLTAEAIVRAGLIAPPCMEHSLVDNFWWEIFGALNARIYEPRMFTEHLHLCAGKSPEDATYRMGADAWTRDWPKWEEFLKTEVPKYIERVKNPAP